MKFFKNNLYTSLLCSHNFFVLLISLIVLFGCKKEEKPEEISISIEFPAPGFNANFYDTIHVVALVSSSTNLKSVSVNLSNSSGVLLVSPVVIYPGSDSYIVDVLLPLNNLYAESGNYYIQVNASTDGSSAHAILPGYVNAVPAETKKIFVVTASDSVSYNVFGIDSLQAGLIFSGAGQLLGSGVSAQFQSVLTCDKNQLTGYDAVTWNTKFNVNPLENITGFKTNDDLNFITLDNGAIKAFDNTGFMQFDTHENPYYSFSRMLHNGDHVFAFGINNNTSEKKLFTFFFPGGDARQTSAIQFSIFDTKKISSSEIMIFGHENGNFQSYKYSVTDNSMNLIKNFGPLSVNDVYQHSSNDYYISTTAGIYHYQYNPSSSTLISSIRCNSISHDKVNNLYYCSSGSEVHILNSSFADDHTFSMSDSVVSVIILYNK